MSEESEEILSETTEEASEPSVTEPEIEEESGASKEPEVTGYQKRINKITADKHAERRRADELEQRLKDLQATSVPISTDVPKLEDFDYDDAKFNKAYIAHEVRKTHDEAVVAQQTRDATAVQTKVNAEFARKVAESAIPDYSDVINGLVGSVPLSEGLINAVMQAENGPEIAYHLGKNLDVADRLAAADPLVAALEIGRISAGLTGKKTKTPSKAPTPVQIVKGDGSGTGKNYEKMSMDEIYNS